MEIIRLFLLSFLTEVTAGQFAAICPIDRLEAEVGDSVILPCRLQPPRDLSAHTSDWKRVDLNNAVHVYRNGKDDIDPQMRQYRTRTHLNHEGLITGILNLRISSLQLSDNGTYKCSVPKLRASCSITLSVVKKHLNKNTTGDLSTNTPSMENEMKSGAERMLVPLFVVPLVLLYFLLLS